MSVKKVEESEDLDSYFMKRAISLARIAAKNGDTPIGALVVEGNKIIGEGYNRIEAEHDPTAHAEMIALKEAGQKKGDWRLKGTTLYVTVEPCIMCAGAALHARVERVVYGTHDDRWGGVGSLFDLSHDPRINHEYDVASGILGDECAQICREFYEIIRDQKAFKKRAYSEE